MDKKQETEYISYHMCGFFWGGGNLKMSSEIFLLNNQTSLKYKQGFENVINLARSEMRSIVAHQIREEQTLR